MTWTLARRAERLNPATIREILQRAERPRVISLAKACTRVLGAAP